MLSHHSSKVLSPSPSTSSKTSSLFTEDQAAAFLGVAPAMLSVWRCTKRYPLPFIKVGRLIRYSEADLIAFLELRRVSQE